MAFAANVINNHAVCTKKCKNLHRVYFPSDQNRTKAGKRHSQQKRTGC